ncbi:MAG: sensor domain-containing diguanylate cyclase [Kofleriaceae bacterium]
MTSSVERLLSVIELQNAIAAAGLNADEVMGLVVERAGTMTAAATSAVILVEGDELAYRAVARPSTLALGARLARQGSAAGRCIADRVPVMIADLAKEALTDAKPVGSLLAVPLLYGESAVGVLEVTSARPGAFSDEDTEALRLLAQVIAIALHRAYTYPRPRHDTQHDALTGLGNKRAFDERIQAELTRDKRYGHSFSLAMLDLGGFEAAVDRFGQAAGDDALREVARILQSQTRAIDACFRIGPDDFALVMPGTSLEGARIVAERCRAHITEARFCEGALVASFGVVEACDETSDALATRAHTAVSADKQAQRAAS